MTYFRLGVILLMLHSAVYGTTTAQMSVDRVGPYVVVGGVHVNGAGPFRFLLDTGATSCSVSHELADRLGVTARWRVELARSARRGEIELVGATAARIRVGGAERSGIEVLIGGSVGEVQKVAPDVDGILGQSFLREMSAYLIDNRAGRLVLEPEPAAVQRGKAVPFEVLYDRPVLRQRSRAWVLDSGAPRHIEVDQHNGLLATAAFDLVYVNNRQRFVVLQRK